MRLPGDQPDEGIEERLQVALEETLNKARATGISLYLTGGTAASLYSASSVRPLSFDLDFLIISEAENPEGSIGKVMEEFGVTFRRFTEKPTFKSYKGVGTSENGCSLDFILDQTVVPDESIPECSLTTFVDEFVASRAQTRMFEGVSVGVVPPEYVVLTKLFAGRGIDKGKYDLVDVATILDKIENNGFDVTFFDILLQKYLAEKSPEQEKAVRDRLNMSIQRLIEGAMQYKLDERAIQLLGDMI